MGNESRFTQMLEMLGNLRGTIDEIDGTTFGRLDGLFDKLAKETDAIIEVADDLQSQIDWEAEQSA